MCSNSTISTELQEPVLSHGGIEIVTTTVETTIFAGNDSNHRNFANAYILVDV
jgi:hypothetical protein